MNPLLHFLSLNPMITLAENCILTIISDLRAWSSSQWAHKCGNMSAKQNVIKIDERRKWRQLCELHRLLMTESRVVCLTSWFDLEKEGLATPHCSFFQMSKPCPVPHAWVPYFPSPHYQGSPCVWALTVLCGLVSSGICLPSPKASRPRWWLLSVTNIFIHLQS